MAKTASTSTIGLVITGPGDHFCCDCFAFNNMPCCNAHHDEAMRSLPEWAEAWRATKCGICGSRLVLVIDMTGEPHVVCSLSGRTECDGGKEAAEYESYRDEAAQQRLEGGRD